MDAQARDSSSSADADAVYTDSVVGTPAAPPLPRLPDDVPAALATAVAAAAATTSELEPLTAATDHVDVLEEYRSLCTREGKYEEAARAVDELARVRRDEQERRCAWLRARHAREREEVAAAHARQLDAFLAEWEAYLDAYDAAGVALLEGMRARHIVQLKDFQDAAHGELLRKPVKFSRELLDWRAREQSLARQRKYSDAAQVKAGADALERRERSKMDAERLASHAAKEARFAAHQAAELGALSSRVALRRVELLAAREADVSRLAQRNKNVLAVLAHRHVAAEDAWAAQVRAALTPHRPPAPSVMASLRLRPAPRSPTQAAVPSLSPPHAAVAAVGGSGTPPRRQLASSATRVVRGSGGSGGGGTGSGVGGTGGSPPHRAGAGAGSAARSPATRSPASGGTRSPPLGANEEALGVLLLRSHRKAAAAVAAAAVPS